VSSTSQLAVLQAVATAYKLLDKNLFTGDADLQEGALFFFDVFQTAVALCMMKQLKNSPHNH